MGAATKEKSREVLKKIRAIQITIWLSQITMAIQGLPDSSVGMQETLVQFLGQEDPLEKRQATHSSILAWRILWTI